MKKVLSIIPCLVLVLSVIVTFPLTVNATYANGAQNSGYDCVAYAKARFREIYGFDLHGTGSNYANGYYYNASSFGDTVSSTPVVGALAVWDSGNVGFSHVAIVEAVSGSNVTISEGGYDGHYNERTFYGDMTIRWNGNYQNFLGYVYVAGTNPEPDPIPQGHVMSESEAAGRTIPDGDYWICSRIAQDYFVDLSGDSIITENGVNVHMWIIGGNLPGKYDVFRFKYLDNGFYQITQMNSGMALDVYEGRLDIGANVNMWQASGSNAQQWSIETTEGGYKLRSRCCAYYLDVSGASYSGGTNLQVWESNNTDAQYFGLIPYAPDERPLADGLYAIGSALSNSCFLDIPGYPENYKIESNVQVWNNMDEKFLIEYAGNGYYQIEVANTDLVLDVNNDGSISYLSNCRNTQICDKNNKRNQRWKIRKNNEGTYYFISQINGYYLDIEGANSAAGTNVSVHQYNGKANQKWKPIRVLQDDMVTVSDVEINSESETVDPNAIVMVDGKKLTANTDYTVQVTTDIANGKGTVTVTGKGNYCDTVTKDFKITYIAPSILGDVDGDGDVSSIDATYIVRYSAQIDVQLDEAALMRGDVDGNEEIEIVDATYIQRFLAEFNIPYPIGEPI